MWRLTTSFWVLEVWCVDSGLLKKGTVQEQLDRFVCNEDWKDIVNMFQVSHLPGVQLDHNPLLLSYNNVYRVNIQHRSFQFLAT